MAHLKPTLKTLFLAILVTAIFQTSSLANEPTRNIISIFQQYLALKAGLVNDGSSKKSYFDLVKEVESFHEEQYLPAVKKTKEIVCKTGNRKLLTEFISVLVHDTGSADEEPGYQLGAIFACQSDLVVSVIGKLRGQEREMIYNQLEFGLGNYYFPKPEPVRLKKKLELLKPNAI